MYWVVLQYYIFQSVNTSVKQDTSGTAMSEEIKLLCTVIYVMILFDPSTLKTSVYKMHQFVLLQIHPIRIVIGKLTTKMD